MEAMHVNVLGYFESNLLPADRSVPRKMRALLAYLAVEGGKISREKISDLLWPYQGLSQGRHSLRNCLLELRKFMPGTVKKHLQAEFYDIGLVNVETDIRRFERLARSQNRESLNEAAQLYRGEFLTDFPHIDSEVFEEWMRHKRESIHVSICEVLQRLCDFHEGEGDYSSAIRDGHRLVAIDPLSEFGYRALMRAYEHAGQRPEALMTFRKCAYALRNELGVDPDAETMALANRIASAKSFAVKPSTLQLHGDSLFLRMEELRARIKADSDELAALQLKVTKQPRNANGDWDVSPL